MLRLASITAVVLASSCATTRLETGGAAVRYEQFRYDGFGVADPERDMKVVSDFEKLRGQRDGQRRARREAIARLKTKPANGESQRLQKVVGDDVVVLVETLPDGVQEKDGRFISTGDEVLLGRFSVATAGPVDTKLLVDEMRALGAAAGGNIVVLSFLHRWESQGQCMGATGVVIKKKNFDPKKTTAGRAFNEI